MADPVNDLEQVQRWMQAVLMHPGGVLAGVESDEARRHLVVAADAVDTVIHPSRQQTSVERLEIYARAYYARLIECLRNEFPMLLSALGESLFDQFAAGYLQNYPSRTYTLGRLGSNFAAYLAATQPASEEDAWLGFLVDLAQLEWCFAEVFDSPGPEAQPALTATALQSIPADQWSACRLSPVTGLRLMRFRFPVHELYQALRRGEQPAPPTPRTSHLVIWRRDYIVRHEELSDLQVTLLRALVDGKSVGEAIELAAAKGDDMPSLAANLENWFRQWIGQGLFSGVLR